MMVSADVRLPRASGHLINVLLSLLLWLGVAAMAAGAADLVTGLLG